MRRVVVTGLGLVTPLGCSVSTVWTRLLEGVVGITALTGPDYATIPCKVAASVPRGSQPNEFNIDDAAPKSDRKYLSNSMLFALHAADQAVRDADLTNLTKEDLERTGVCLGMGMVDLQDVLNTGSDLQRGYSKVSPYFIPRILPNLAAGHISMKYGFQGPNHCVSTACTTGLHSVGDAFRFIQHGDADMMISGGTEAAINPISIAAFARMRALSIRFNDKPETSSRPFDKNRDGFVMGEGAGVLVLEELSHAVARNAKIYAEILGYGLSSDANHMTSPREDGRGAVLCMQRALNFAGVTAAQVGYINCHATSTPAGDKAEAKAIFSLFGKEKTKNVAISSTKGATGHLLGAAGAVESVFTVLACHTGIIPPTANLENPESDFEDLNLISKMAAKWTSKTDRRLAVKNSFGFGGTNASVCFAEVSA